MAGTGGLTTLQRSVLDRVEHHLPDAPVVVALSGGPDSAVCAWAASLRGRSARAVTVDHGLAASADLAAAAAAVAGVLGMAHRVVAIDPTGSSETELRPARYRALQDSLDAGEVLLTGHTADDQAETVLGNLLRGAGAGGLSGIPRRRGHLLRPLLEVTRAEVRSVADELGLPYADDPTNRDPGPRRNLLRHRVIPLLEAEVNPQARAALARAGGLLAADDRLLEDRAARVPVRVDGARVRLPAAALATLPPPVAARVARRALRVLLSPYPGRAADVDAVLQIAAGAVRRRSLTGEVSAEREGPWVTLQIGPAPVPPDVTLPVPGRVRFGRWEIEAAMAAAPPRPAPVGRRCVHLDPGAAVDLTVRGAVAGDRVPIEAGSKPVAEALREAGIPARLRPGWPLLCSGGRILWVVGARVASGVAAAAGRTLVLSMREAQ